MDVDEVLKKYSKKIEQQMQTYDSANTGTSSSSKEYSQFKQDMLPEFSKYEKWAHSLGNFVKVKLAPKDEAKISKQLAIAHLEISPSEVTGLAIVSFLGVFFVGALFSVINWLLFDSFPILFLVLMLITSFFLFYYFYSMPERLAVKWRLKASSQMVPAILYAVIYMKHTSNLERAISFVGQHVEAPLSMDMRKVLWDVETGKFSSIKESLDHYLDFWKEHNIEFVESFHLIESSLYEPNEARRILILERSLKVILDGVYERMLKYSHSIKAPLTNLYMLGIVLPTLGLALLPLASTLLKGAIRSNHLFMLFNIIIPFFVFYLTLQIMLKRPGGYGESSLLERNPHYNQYISKQPYYRAALICAPFLLLGLLPLLYGYTPIPGLFGLPPDFSLSALGINFLGETLFGFQESGEGVVGPFGVASLLLSLLIPFSVAMFFVLSFSMRTKELIKARDETKKLEKEFNSSLFTLGNRLGDGTPAEVVFAKVAESTKGQRTSEFFKVINTNIRTMGMSVEAAIFDPQRGAIVYYPSNLIATSMRILVEGVKKGLKVAAQSLMSISDYVRNIQKINERLRDLLADVVSDMKSNMTFLAPLLSGIIIGLAAMITAILSKFKTMVDMGGGNTAVGGMMSVGTISDLFNVVDMIPPYFMQIAIGIYLIQVVFILTRTLITIDAGEDKLKQTYDISKNLIRGMILYLITAFLSIVALSALASVALGNLGNFILVFVG